MSTNGADSNTNGDNFATTKATPKTGSDCISDERMAEIARRLQITIPVQKDSDIWSGAEPPEDKSLLWWPLDPTNGTRIGDVPKKWDAATGMWIDTGKTTPTTKIETRFGRDTVAADATKVVTFAAMPGEYFVTITITSRIGTTFSAPAANMDNFDWEITNQAADTFSITFFAVPAGGVGFDWKVEQIT